MFIAFWNHRLNAIKQDLTPCFLLIERSRPLGRRRDLQLVDNAIGTE